MTGFCSIALRKLLIEEAIGRIAAGGFRGIEIWHAHVEQKSAGELAELAALGREDRFFRIGCFPGRTELYRHAFRGILLAGCTISCA
jgi:sugar phosphate isomerase/epimerase